jgi:hypothetical protein
MSANEHILLESDAALEVPDARAARKVHARVRLKSRLRRRILQLEIIDYYFLSVRSWRSGALLAEYVVDLRFAQAAPRLSRFVAWRWMMSAVALLALGCAIAVRVVPSAPRPWLYVCAGLLAAGVSAALTCAYRTSETIALHSAHGHAKCLEYTGGIGTLRAARVFLTKLAAHTQLAMRARRHSKAAHLRDEMREHFRLKEAGTLSVEEYEAAKVRILGQHAR